MSISFTIPLPPVFKHLPPLYDPVGFMETTPSLIGAATNCLNKQDFQMKLWRMFNMRKELLLV